MKRRHGAEVTADKLREALDRWPEAFDGNDRDAIGRIIHALEQVAADAVRVAFPVVEVGQ